jgi:hypothetical protein
MEACHSRRSAHIPVQGHHAHGRGLVLVPDLVGDVAIKLVRSEKGKGVGAGGNPKGRRKGPTALVAAHDLSFATKRGQKSIATSVNRLNRAIKENMMHFLLRA